jgi:hypothetical protein
MKIPTSRTGKPGYISYLLVLTTGTILTLLSIYTYRRAMNAHAVQSAIQLRTDYSEKEEAILRSIVAITPNRAIRAMQAGSNSNATSRDPLRWQNIFTEALANANASTSISSGLVQTLGLQNHRIANTGDSSLTQVNGIFGRLSDGAGYVSVGINRSLGAGFPPPLTTSNLTTIDRDPLYPIITSDKLYGDLAQTYLNSTTLNGDGTVAYGLPVASYAKNNILKYPDINFGYSRPGQPFVAKQNWWGFSMNLAAQDAATTLVARPRRLFVLSLYEIPSQLAISADSFMALGQFASGEAWQNVTIDGGVFAGKALVEGSTTLSALASRRGMNLSGDSSIGGQSFAQSPFMPGVREAYQVTNGEFFPVSLASESGRVAFVPINRGALFFDRFAHSTENNVLSPTKWNNYSIGALQCAMRLDIADVVSSTNPTPTKLRFSYLKSGARQTLDIPLTTATSGATQNLPPGYIFAANENQAYNFGTAVVDVAYGLNGAWAYQTGVTGSVTFNNARFGDPLVGTVKSGYYKPSYPFPDSKLLPSGKICIPVYPQRFKAFLAALNADGPDVNNSLVVNVDYSAATGSVNLSKPVIPCVDFDPTNGKHQYGVILQECADLSTFTKGFSLVTNLRTYIGDDFNIVAMTPPTGYTPPGLYYPPVSLFTPERRYGVEVDPFAVKLDGQIGSLASDLDANPVRPMDSKAVSGNALAADRITVNLKPIRHPADLPPITMMNWLLVLQELRSEFISN